MGKEPSAAAAAILREAEGAHRTSREILGMMLAGGGSDCGDHRDAGHDPGDPEDDADPAGHHRAAARLARVIAAARLRQGRHHAAAVATAGAPEQLACEQAGFGLKERAWNDRALVGLWRQRWAEMANARLAELGHDVRIDHRSHAARGLALEPQNKIGPAASRKARQGEDGDRTAEHRAIARRNGERLLAEPALALRGRATSSRNTGRLQIGTVGDIGSECLGDIVGIRSPAHHPPA